VPDTNILISALFWSGPPYRVMQLAASCAIKAYSSGPILSEFQHVLERSFGICPAKVREIADAFRRIVTVVRPEVGLCLIAEDTDDNRILECADAVRAGWIVTGDHHLLKLKTYKCTRILTAREFLQQNEYV
jgi:putative PIN family toxin of toxin-antitoxin system